MPAAVTPGSLPDPHRAAADTPARAFPADLTVHTDLTVRAIQTGSGAVDSAYALLDALRHLGMSDLVIAPGSRSAPVVYAAHRLGVRRHVRIDERAAAFTALGLSRVGQPHGRFAAVATTSGTAVAHLLAAAMESHHSGVPLMLLTADRPAELRGTGANQTTIQPGLFQPFARFSADLPAPDAHTTTSMQLRTWTDSAARAAAAALHGAGGPGPVHLNLGFRDPLTPKPGSAEIPAATPTAATPDSGADDSDTGTTGGPAHAAITLPRFTAMTRTGQGTVLSPRSLIVVGDCTDPALGRAAAILAQRTGLPIVAEPSSNARRQGFTLLTPAAVTAGLDAAPPDDVLVIGRPTLARPVIRGLLANDAIRLTIGTGATDWVDPGRRAVRVIEHLDPLLVRVQGEPDREFQQVWESASADALPSTAQATTAEPAPAQTSTLQASTAQPHGLDPRPDLSWQTRAALAVWNASGPKDTLVLGASALIRDIDQHGGPTDARIIANRGLAGIDGTIAMASGIALAQQRSSSQVSTARSGWSSADGAAERGRVRVLLGDITALHDLTGLIIGPHEQQPELDIIVVDDGGGRIFAGLEHAEAPADLLERFFTTPHGTDIAAAAQALGVPAQRVTADELPAALAERSHAAGTLVRTRRLILVTESARAPETH